MPSQPSTSIVKFYQTLTDWVSSTLSEVGTLPGRGITWIKNREPHVREAFKTYLHNIIAIAKRQFALFYKVGKAFLGRYRWQIISGTALVAAGVSLYYLWKKWEATKLREVSVDLKSTLNLATLSVRALKRKQKPINVMLTIVIDKSGSMNGARQKAVVKAICDILESSKDLIRAPKNAKIRIAITAFNGQAESIQEMVQLSSSNIESIRKKVEAIRSEGNTAIIKGLQDGLKEVEKVKNCEHTLIVLTDGEDQQLSLGIEAIQERFASAKVKVFAVGIGGDHNKESLRKLVDSSGSKFEGKYIDMTQRTSTIADVVADIYAQAISSHHLHLIAPLEPGTWSMAGRESVKGSIPHQSSCDMGLLSEGEEKTLEIRIHPDKLTTPIDLSKLAFTLSNASGQSLRLPWSGNTIIDTDVIRAVSKLRG